MIHPEVIKIALVLMMRAPLKGEEAENAAAAMKALQNLYVTLTSPRENKDPEEQNVNDA